MYPFLGKVTLGDELLSALKPKFVEVGAPMKEMWEVATSKSPYISRRSRENPEKMEELTKLLHRFSNDFRRIDRAWAHDALDKASILQRNKQVRVVPKPALPYRPCYGGGPPIGGPSASGMMMSESNMFGGSTASLLVEPLPSPWTTCPSPPPPSSHSVEVVIHPPSTSTIASLHLLPTLGYEYEGLHVSPTFGYEYEGFPEPERPEHAKSDKASKM